MYGFYVQVSLSLHFNLLFIVTVAGALNITFRMLEEQKPGYVFGNILEKYTLDRNDLRFAQMKQGNTPGQLFYVDDTSGNLSTITSIDRETQCEFTLTCEIPFEIAVQTTHNDGFFDVIEVLVIIDDINDNAPLFATSFIDLGISEAVVIGAVYTLDGARDRDMSAQFSIKSYELQSFIPGERLPFDITTNINLDGSSMIKLKINQKLDREEKDSYKFYVVAKDGGSPTLNGTLLVNVTVLDVNDNNPQFNQSSYNVTVKEDVMVNTTILTLTAFDKDLGKNSDVIYRFSSFQLADNLKYFFINEISGELKVRKALNLITDTNFNIIVEAFDQGDVSLTNQSFVYITVLDTSNSAPDIRLNLLSSAIFCRISEYANIGAVVAYVAIVDRDSGRNGEVNCSILSDNFGLQKYDGMEYKVIVASSLDREQADAHNVTVYCEDRGVPPMSSSSSFLVKIDDENDNPPRFRQQRYFANIDENNEVRDVIQNVSAFDIDTGNNSKLTYSVDSAFSQYAFVNSETGIIMANKVFDKESADGQGVSLLIYVTDNGNPPLTGTASVIITINDINDNKPIFKQDFFQFWVEENLPVDTSVGTLVAEDIDTRINAATRYTQKNFSDEVPFVVFMNGVINTNRELDRESVSEYMFEVKATDAGNERLYSTATVTVFVVDVNDNSPQIIYPQPGNNTAYVPYLTHPNSVIYSVVARDLDESQTNSSKLIYSLTVLNTTNIFAINSVTGDITVTAPLANTNYLNKLFMARVDVTDGTNDASAGLNIMITSDNRTASLITDKSSINESSRNFIIVVLVATVTVVISASIIVTICIIRRLDMRRQKDKAKQKVLSENMYCRNTDEDVIFPQLPMDDSFTEKKRKEVSFALEENVTLDTNKSGLYDHRIAYDSFDHILLEPPSEYELSVSSRAKLDDSHSDMSGESNGDSGKGGSDDGMQIATLGCKRDDNLRPKERWENRRSKSPGAQPLKTFPNRCQNSSKFSQQKMIPFSFKNDQSFIIESEHHLNNVSHAATLYNLPIDYDDETQFSIGFHSTDSNSNLNMHIPRHLAVSDSVV